MLSSTCDAPRGLRPQGNPLGREEQVPFQGVEVGALKQKWYPNLLIFTIRNRIPISQGMGPLTEHEATSVVGFLTRSCASVTDVPAGEAYPSEQGLLSAPGLGCS